MTAAERLNLISVEDYLECELVSDVKHEYLGGFVYAMAGAKRRHNRIATNVVAALHAGLRGKPCEPFNSDMKVRAHLQGAERFYYPDVSLTCTAVPDDVSYHTEPAIVVEVISESTRRIDEGEKKDAYLNIPSLRAYVLVEQETQLITVYRRGESAFERETYTKMDEVIALPEIETQLQLAEIYDRVEFG